MKVLFFPLLLVGLLAGCVNAASQLNLTQILGKLPACSIDCLFKGLPPDALTDLTKTCTNVTLQASLLACIQGRCDYTEQHQVAIVDSELCAGVPIPTRQWQPLIVGVVCGPVALGVIILRCYSRYTSIKYLGWDDWLVAAAGVVLIPLIILDCYDAFVNGFGRHYWNIDPLRVTGLLKIFYVSEILYLFVVTLVKASITALYFRVFPSTPFRYAAGSVMVVVVSSGVALILAVIFQCTPTALAWDLTLQGKCININQVAYAAGAISVALDVIILVLPLPVLARLQMGRKKKVNLIFMFSLGIVALITSIVRLKYLVSFANSKDPTWDNVDATIWSFLEISVMIICACLPGLRGLLSRYISFFSFSPHYPNEPSNSSTTAIHKRPSAVVKQVRGSSPIAMETIFSRADDIEPYRQREKEFSDQTSKSSDEQRVQRTQYERRFSAHPSTGSNVDRKRHERPLSSQSPVLGPISPKFSKFTYSNQFSEFNFVPEHPPTSSMDVDLESGSGGSTRVERGPTLPSPATTRASISPQKIWINPKFDSEGNVVQAQRPALRDIEPYSGTGSLVSHSISEIERDFSPTPSPRKGPSSLGLNSSSPTGLQSPRLVTVRGERRKSQRGADRSSQSSLLGVAGSEGGGSW